MLAPRFALPVLAALIAVPAPVRAEGPDQAVAVHGQATLVVQGVGGFAAPYAGDNSLAPRQTKETLDLTAYLGLRPWRGAELWANPELDQGFGLSDTLGVAGFPSAEAYKVGKARPYAKLQRLFLRQTVALGGAPMQLDPAANQLGMATRANRLVLTIGKFSVGDVFDGNRLAHDPRGDFLNWSLVDTGSLDYAANAWGYSYGAAAEWYQGAWTLRAGLFNLSRVPNGIALETGLGQNELVGEIEHRHHIGSRAGALRLTAFRNHGRFARLDEALAAAGAAPPDPARVRRAMDRAGIAFNADQDVTGTLALFVRAGSSDGAIETYDFTDIDRTLALGGTLAGKGWGRAGDSLGLAIVTNAISPLRQRFLAAGGLGVLVGDGRLPHPGDERILEGWYAWRSAANASITFDLQHVTNPGYNRDRGPATILALRLHAGF